MSEYAISIEHLSKKYCRSLRRSLVYGIQDLGTEVTGLGGKRTRLRKDEFWALQDVSLEVRRGETIGLIGRNGAGKTTLLKLLSGLIKPDIGRIELRGRLQALIALGAGFNPVLTGRENIYVNAAILGISKADISRKFDEIVDFSGLAEYIDMPVQSYSSGMVVRLGFAVAAHLEPDILLVDEVLAVGDIPFRAKCHRKLGELKEAGVPWVMVSHDMGIIRNQTTRVVYMERGKVRYIGDPEQAIGQYLYDISEQDVARSKEDLAGGARLPKNVTDVAIGDVRLLDECGQEKDYFQTGDPLVIEINYYAPAPIENPNFGVFFVNGEGITLTGANTSASRFPTGMVDGWGKIYYRLDILPMPPGIYRVRVDAWDKNMGLRDKRTEAAYLHVRVGKFAMGMFYAPHYWSRTP